jgi:hypothetical protein
LLKRKVRDSASFHHAPFITFDLRMTEKFEDEVGTCATQSCFLKVDDHLLTLWFSWPSQKGWLHIGHLIGFPEPGKRGRSGFSFFRRGFREFSNHGFYFIGVGLKGGRRI